MKYGLFCGLYYQPDPGHVKIYLDAVSRVSQYLSPVSDALDMPPTDQEQINEGLELKLKAPLDCTSGIST